MLWIILIAMGAYIVADAAFDVSEKISRWVRAVAGKAWDFVAGNGRKAPARAAVVTEKPKTENRLQLESDQAPKAPIDWPKLAGDIWKFIWFWRYWIMAALIAWFAWGLLRPVVSFVTCPFGLGPFCASKSDDDALERVNTQVAQHETGVAVEAIDLAGRTNSNINAANEAARRGQQEIEDAIRSLPPVVSGDDFAGLDRVYRDAYLGVYGVSPSEPDSNPGRSRPMRGSGTNAT